MTPSHIKKAAMSDKKSAFRLPAKAAAPAEKAEPVKADPRELLKKAIARHEGHMTGAEPVSDDSQAKMMDEMRGALAAMDAQEESS